MTSLFGILSSFSISSKLSLLALLGDAFLAGEQISRAEFRPRGSLQARSPDTVLFRRNTIISLLLVISRRTSVKGVPTALPSDHARAGRSTATVNVNIDIDSCVGPCPGQVVPASWVINTVGDCNIAAVGRVALVEVVVLVVTARWARRWRWTARGSEAFEAVAIPPLRQVAVRQVVRCGEPAIYVPGDLVVQLRERGELRARLCRIWRAFVQPNSVAGLQDKQVELQMQSIACIFDKANVGRDEVSFIYDQRFCLVPNSDLCNY
ncbi:hypothetical protein KC354_g92 [Hortaea werneckii]|nr:hypothetical protein KC354_g92 [Hortaea werneckii]